MILYYLKDLAMIFLYTSILRANNEVFLCTVNYVAMAIVMALGPVVSKYLYGKYDEKLRFLGFVPIIVSFFVSPLTINNLVFALAPAIYTGALVIMKFKELEYYSFIKLFRILLIAGGLMLVVHFALILEIFSQGGYYDKSNIVAGLRYYAAFFVISVFIARKLRFNADKVQRGSFAGLLAVVGAAAVISVVISFCKDYVYKALSFVLMIVIMPFGYLYKWWEAMMYDAQGMGAIASADPQKYFEAEWSEMVVVGYDKPMPEYDLPVDVIVLVIIVIVLGVLLFMSIKILNIKGRVNSRDEFEKEKVKGLKKVKSASRFSNREKVRKIYRQFLDIMVGRGVKVTENMTSQEILELLSGKMSYEHALALRNVYIHARYNDYGNIKEEDVRLAKEALKKLSAT